MWWQPIQALIRVRRYEPHIHDQALAHRDRSWNLVGWTEDGQVVANSGNVLIGEASQEFYMFLDGDSFAAAHVIIDITGYYVPA